MSGAQIDADVALKIAIRLLSEGPWLGDMATLPDYHLAHDCALAESSINTANNSSCKLVQTHVAALRPGLET
jgi:hypothetical protein